MAGKISRTEFGKRLAQEWASFPVLAPVQGAHRKLKRGQSYYAGDGVNKALVTPGKVEAVLIAVKKNSSNVVQATEDKKLDRASETLAVNAKPRVTLAPATKKEAIQSVGQSKRFWTWALTVLGTPLAAFGALDWRVQLALVAVLTGVGLYAVTTMPQVRKLLGLA